MMNRKLWGSLASLYGIHASNYLVPLFTLPYLAHVMGAAEWGAFAFADAYGRVVALAVEYGFGLSATREIARFRHDPHARSRELSGVLGAQLLLGAFTLLMTLVLARTIPVFTAHRRLLPGALFLAMSQGANPMWYFQGMERLRIMGYVWMVGRMAGAAGLFLFVHAPGDGGLALFIQGTAPFLSVIVGLVMAYRDMPFLRPSLARGWNSLRAGGSVFMFRAGVNLYSSLNVVLLGLLAAPVEVAWFAGADKIARAAVAGTGPITQLFFPRINHLLVTDRHGAAKAARESSKLMMSVGLGAALLLLSGAPLLVRMTLGAGFEGSVPVLRLMALLPPLVALSSVFGVQWMLSLGLNRELNRIVFAAIALDMTLSLGLGRLYHHMGVAASLVIVEVFVTAATFLVLWHKGLIPWSTSPLRAEKAVA
jgi:PST family polysaccharide transporter